MIDLKSMLDAGVHFGHKTSRWSPKMRPYIWGARNKVHLIDISKTAFLLERSGAFVRDLAADGGSFLWVGTKKPAQDLIREVAGSLNMPYVVHRWIGGTLSNFDQVKKAITRLLHYRDIVKKSASYYKKKELVVMQKEIERLEKNIGGIIDLEYPPAAIIVVDGKKEHAVIKEASALGIPVVGLIDTNTDPDGVSLVIPGNDDSPKSIKFVLDYLSACVQEGKALAEQRKLESKNAANAAAAAKKDAAKAPVAKAKPEIAVEKAVEAEEAKS